MPLKQLNSEWDQEDPNRAIPDHDRDIVKDVEEGPDAITPIQAAKSQHTHVGKDGDISVVHLEEAENSSASSSHRRV